MLAGLLGVLLKSLFGSAFGALAGILAQYQMKQEAAVRQAQSDTIATQQTIIYRVEDRSAINQEVQQNVPQPANDIPTTGKLPPVTYLVPGSNGPTVVTDSMRDSWDRD